MQISIAYSNNQGEQAWIELEVADKSTVEEAIQASGFLSRFPEIDLETQKIGIFGKLVKTSQVLEEFDRVEIYRPITADPKTVPRRATEKEKE
ncbi:RnfH family protein [Marinospirillum sp.]|uniref:RnfH family protein n=1 Tax=Marinospirillum sp. TaxID=2183934 RepID=UPI0028709AB8|nr:RnfH family protein [Marinospirillum sp.]MDR9467935.1 RnfH family protein [Marinospirillum sp.]